MLEMFRLSFAKTFSTNYLIMKGFLTTFLEDFHN